MLVTSWATISSEVQRNVVAKQGLPQAQYHVGTDYYVGRLGERDIEVAYAWFSAAAAQGHLTAIRAKNTVGAQFDPESLASAQKLASVYYDSYVVPFQ